MRPWPGLRVGSAVALLVFVLLGCRSQGRSVAWTDMYSLELRSRGQVAATWTLWGGWDVETLPPLPPGLMGTSEPFTVAGYGLDGEAIPISSGAEHSIGYRLAVDAPGGVLDLAHSPEELYNGGEIRLYRAGPGTTRIELTLIHGGEVRQRTTPISVTVME